MRKQIIPFHKVPVSQKEINNVVSVIKSGWWSMGTKTIEFEKKFKKIVNSKYAISTNSCTAALHLALIATGLKSGDEVLVPSMTFSATAEAVIYTGAKPILVDVDKDTHILDIEDLKKKINKKTKAIITVDYAGQPANYQNIFKVARQNKLFVIEDAAHALPSKYKKKIVGSFADLTCFSFYTTKTLAIGDGGMITTNNKNWAERLKKLRLHGIDNDAWKRYKRTSWYYEIFELGYKYNMTDIDAAIGLAQLSNLYSFWKERQKIANRYTEAFSKTPEIIPPKIKNNCQTSWHLYVIKLKLENLTIDRAEFIEELSRRGISTSVHFIPLHRQPFYKKLLNVKNSQFPNSEWLYERIISLPIFPKMTRKEINHVINSVCEIVKEHKK